MSPRNHIVPTVAELCDFGGKSVLAKHKVVVVVSPLVYCSFYNVPQTGHYMHPPRAKYPALD